MTDDIRTTARPRGAGGTPGGIGEFFLGAALALAGGYLLMQQVTVTTGFWSLWGVNMFGVVLLPLMLGIGLLFYNGRSVWGKVLTAGSLFVILVGIIANLQLFFRPASLFVTLVILAMLAAGIGLVARSLRAH
jgi:hypothetical protein